MFDHAAGQRRDLGAALYCTSGSGSLNGSFNGCLTEILYKELTCKSRWRGVRIYYLVNGLAQSPEQDCAPGTEVLHESICHGTAYLRITAGGRCSLAASLAARGRVKRRRQAPGPM